MACVWEVQGREQLEMHFAVTYSKKDIVKKLGKIFSGM